MKTYILTLLNGTTKEVKAEWFTFDPTTRSVEFHKAKMEGPLAAFTEVYSVEEKPE